MQYLVVENDLYIGAYSMSSPCYNVYVHTGMQVTWVVEHQTNCGGLR